MTALAELVSHHRTRSRWISIASVFLIAIIASAVFNPFGIGDSSASSSSGGAPGFLNPFGVGDSSASSSLDGAPAAVLSQLDATPVADATPVDGFDCETVAPGVGSEPWVRSELYFGVPLAAPGQMLSEEELQAFLDNEWQAFLDTEITPRFPDGLTVLSGYGQFLNSSGVITQEDSIVLIIFIPLDAVPAASVGINEIREAYKAQFDQESVLRADATPVCISF